MRNTRYTGTSLCKTVQLKMVLDIRWLKGGPQKLYQSKTIYSVITLSIGTPYLLTILVLKFEIVHLATSW